jgi:hypothetical protein
MKRSRIITMSAVVIFTLGLLALSGCAGPGGWSLVGTWVNGAYDNDGTDTTMGKIVISPENKITLYVTTSATTSDMTGTLYVDDEWTEGENHYFKARTVTNSTPPDTFYGLVRLSQEGRVWEANSTDTGTYPTGIDATASDYQFYTRVEG